MAFILHTTRSVSRSGVRMLSLHKLLFIAASGSFLLVVLAFCAGVVVGQHSERTSLSNESMAKTDPVRERFAFDRLGDMTVRLVRLETEARSLVKKLSALETLESRLGELKPGSAKPSALPVANGGKSAGGAGGVKLPPKGCAEKGSESATVEDTEKTLACMQELLSKVEAAATKRSVNYMAMPIKRPVDAGRMGSPFGNRVDPFHGNLAFHSGLDFEADTGTPIRAAGGGRVMKAGWLSDYGYLVEIDHGNGLLTRYAHCSKLLVKIGEVVTPGQLIAEVGSTGRSTGPHLHFEILHNGRFVDPKTYLNIGSQVPNV